MKLFYMVMTLLITLFSSGCIDDDTTDCIIEEDNNLILKFHYKGNSDEELFTKTIQNVNVFIFRQNGQFVTARSISSKELTAFAGVALNIKPDDYHIVFWGNLSEKTFVPTLALNSRLIDGFVTSAAARNGAIVINGDTLYHAIDDFVFSPTLRATTASDVLIERDINFNSAHIKVLVYVRGLDDKDSQGKLLPPTIEMTGIPSGYDFGMQLWGDTISYLNSSSYKTIAEEETAAITFYTPRFANENRVTINIKKSSDGSTLTAINLKNFMLENKITVEGVRQPIVPILVEYKQASVEISVPEWVQTPIDPEL